MRCREGTRLAPGPDRMLATILSIDVVGSTAKAVALGDRGWASLFEQHHRGVRLALARYRGVGTTPPGDGAFTREVRDRRREVVGIAVPIGAWHHMRHPARCSSPRP